MNKIKDFYQKHKEVILYLFYGGLTTLVSFVSFWLCDLAFGVSLVSLSEFISWVLAVAFAYVVNKLFVFESKSWAWGVLKKELPPFVLARVFSFFVEWGGILLLVHPLRFSTINLHILGFNITGSVLAKLILSVVVVIMNYFFSKFLIFAKKGNEKKEEEPTTNTTASSENQSATEVQQNDSENIL